MSPIWHYYGRERGFFYLLVPVDIFQCLFSTSIRPRSVSIVLQRLMMRDSFRSYETHNVTSLGVSLCLATGRGTRFFIHTLFVTLN